ncbi:perlucin-like protein [Dreissena polymorpha]|uniref:C-type lectin domain-containing protein n=1 Tax=Dreissena polymorpha TaxID=45954 RepID=A0A9D4R6T5_DREPO|nr:perlucin-like protein [Dreissena polymorpha]KAH3855375.1 hypothetical protein DPMN_097942 [Dreissena polymorpha]
MIMALLPIIIAVMTAAFIAQTGASALCDDGWTAYGSSCYFSDDKTQMHWAEGTNYCQAHGGAYITTIQSEGEFLFLQDMCRRLFKNDRNNFFYLGATDEEIEGIWRWYTDNSLVNEGYHNWSPGQPNARVNENCAVLWGPNDYTWHDHFCNENAYVICEKPGLKRPEVVG